MSEKYVTSISEFIGKNISDAVFDDNHLFVSKLNDYFPELDFSKYETSIDNETGNEIISEFALYEELFNNSDEFKEKIFEIADDYREFGFCANDETLEMIRNQSYCIMDSYENLFDVGKFGSKGCLSNAEYMDELTDSYEFKKKIIKHKGKKRRAVDYKK